MIFGGDLGGRGLPCEVAAFVGLFAAFQELAVGPRLVRRLVKMLSGTECHGL